MQFWNGRRTRLQDEIQNHIELEIEENIQSGMSPEAAREAAQKKFGNTLLTVERSREMWGGLWFEYLLHDLRYGMRSLLRSPGYMAAVVLTLALGLGSVTTILAVIDSVLLRPVSLPHPEELVVMYGRSEQPGSFVDLSNKQIDALRHDGRSLAAVASYNTTIAPVSVADGSRTALLNLVSPEYFQVLGAPAQMGRVLTRSDATQPVVVLSHEFWLEELHGDPHAVGSTIRVSSELRTVVGVLPQGIDFPTRGPVVYMPVAEQQKGSTFLSIDASMALARLKPGVTASQALAEVRGFLEHIHDSSGVAGSQLMIVPVTRFLTSSLQTPLLALLGGVGILLLIACANAASLQIARAIERLPEMQVRSALGASFPRLLQQLVVESLIVSLGSAVVGGGLAFAAIAAIRHAYGDQFPRFQELAVHPSVLAAVVLLAMVAGLLASLAPAFSTRRRTVAAAAARRTTTSRNRASAVLVTTQITLTCVLLVTCGLFVRTFFALRQVPLGFDPHHVTTLVVMPQHPQVSGSLLQSNTLLLHRLESLPGVEAAAMQTSIPFSSFAFNLNGTTDISGRPFQKSDTANYSIVSSGFVRASGIRVLQGRGFLPQDDGSANIVVLVNQAFVDKYLAGRNPLGVGLKMHRDPTDKDSDMPILQGFTIVGVVQNEVQGGDLASEFQPMIYLDDLQIPKESMFLQIYGMMSQFAIRSPLPQDALNKEIRGALKQTAPDMAEMQLQPMEEAIANSLEERRMALRLVSGFGAMALVLAAVGIYGMLAYTVNARRREIGVRMALGSSRTGVSRLVLQQAARMVAWGLVPGIAGAWAAEHAVRSFLFGVKPLDPLALAGTAAVLAMTAAVAAALPAWRAARVDPMEVLRVE
ncbi:ADOP family duplicated permease [Silvibacterium sp.]|uniref:ADOP family duplicated permease n=1 Tax=Silvibacterium sp. TaxID=1964179 RepID=UPI0039E2973F